MSTVAISAYWYPGLYSRFYCIPSFLLPVSPCFCGVGLSTFSPKPSIMMTPPKKNIWWTLEHDTPYRFGGVEDKKNFYSIKYIYINILNRQKERSTEPYARPRFLDAALYAAFCSNYIKVEHLWLFTQSTLLIYKTCSFSFCPRFIITRHYIQNSVDNRLCPVISRMKGVWSVEP